MRFSPIIVTAFIIFANQVNSQAAQYYFSGTENVIDEKKITFPLREELEHLVLRGEKSKNLKVKKQKEFILNGTLHRVFEVEQRGVFARAKKPQPWFVALNDKNKIIEMNLDLMVGDESARVDIILDK